MQKYIASKGNPSKFKMLTLLMSSVREDASDWKEAHHIAWDVGYTTDIALLKDNCPKIQTPCTLVMNENAEIQFVTNGVVHPEQIENIVGGW